MPTNIALGSSLAVTVEMFIPYPSRTYTFKVRLAVLSLFNINYVCGFSNFKIHVYFWGVGSRGDDLEFSFDNLV